MSRADDVIAFIEAFCVTPEGEHVGKPIKLEDFQKQFLRDIYDNPDGTNKAILSVARKNGKSALIAGILLAHLVGPEAVRNSQIVSGAMSRDQAALVFKLAVKMIGQSEFLTKNIKVLPSGKSLIGLPMNVEYKALAADGKTAHGLSPVLAILDEVGQVRGPRSDFIDAITTSQGAHANPLLVVISTQAANDADLLSQWIDDAKKSGDPHTICHLYSAPEGCDLMDEEAWKAANPALGLFRTYSDLSTQASSAIRMPSMANSFRNLLLNQRVSTDAPFISADVWKSNGAEPGEPEGAAYAGLDLSSRRDLTALVVVVKQDGIWKVYPYFWTPKEGLHDRAAIDKVPYDLWVNQGFLRTTPGASVDYEYVAHDIAEILSDFDIRAIAFDRWRIDIFKKEIERAGVELPLIEWGQGYKDMSPAIESLEVELVNNRMAHGLHPVLTMCAMNSVTTKDPAGSRKFDKSKETGRIDGMQALAMALGVAGTFVEEEKKPITMFMVG